MNPPTEEPNTDSNAWMARFHPEDALDAARRIEHAFIWHHTPEGHKYWRQVTNRLREMAREYKASD